jgi:hypothetical protein
MYEESVIIIGFGCCKKRSHGYHRGEYYRLKFTLFQLELVLLVSTTNTFLLVRVLVLLVLVPVRVVAVL